MIHSSLIKNNEYMTYQFMKVLGNVKYQYFLLVNVVTMPNIDSNNIKLPKLSLCVIKNHSEIETAMILRQICSLNLRRSTVLIFEIM